MTDAKNKTGKQFDGLPMESLIGAPLKAACDAQAKLAESTAEFIRKTGGQDSGTKKAETVAFAFRKREADESGVISEKEMNLQVPLLSIVPVPSLVIEGVDVSFDMETKSSPEQAGTGKRQVKGENHRQPTD